jgi:prepilin-type N-terminal cleavage/methylation domain-containing protein
MFIRSRGFTVIELLIVIVVLGVLTSVIIASYNNASRRAYTSSLQLDVTAMDKAQKTYMTLTGTAPLSYNSDGSANDVLVFAPNRGNTIVVKLLADNQYCIYGYNPASLYPTPAKPLVRSSSGATCGPLTETEIKDPSSVYSTVAIIGQRLEAFKDQHGEYPQVRELSDIGLVIKPNNDTANQQQLYCRNQTKAIYLQVDRENNVVYVYDTATKQIQEPVDLGKLSLDGICEQFNITPSTPGYESTGVKNPDI